MKLLFSLALLLITLPGVCQDGEYLVKNNGDTIRGEINLIKKVFYVTGTKEEVINADDVAKVKTKNYKGNTVLHCNLLTYSDNLSDLQIDFINKGSLDTVLILQEVYTSPKINLYYTVSKDKTPFYFYKTPADTRPVQLVVRYFLQGGLANYDNDRIRYRGQKSLLTITEDKGYANQLFSIMGNCKKITPPMWELLTYRIYSLKKIMKVYNKCK
jgi:hypothetical protein